MAPLNQDPSTGNEPAGLVSPAAEQEATARHNHAEAGSHPEPLPDDVSSSYESLQNFSDEYVVPEPVEDFSFSEARIEDNRIGQLLLRHRMMTLDQLEECLDYQDEHPGMQLGEVFVERGITTVEDIHSVLKLQLGELRLGQILLRTKCISQEQLDIALVDQENTGELLGSILIGFAFCTPEQINWAIDQQAKD